MRTRLVAALAMGLAFTLPADAQHAMPPHAPAQGHATPGGHAQAPSYKAGDLTITTPWSRATPGSARVAGGFFQLLHRGTQPDRLVSAYAPDIAGRVEIHETTLIDGVMRMREKEDGIALPAGATTEFRPGGLHVMFMDLKRPLKEGERFKADLVFEKAGTVPVEFTVRAMGAGAAPAH